MISKLRALWSRHVVSEVPDEQSACLECGIVRCEADRYDACPFRLQRQSELTELRARCQPKSDQNTVESAAE